MSGPAKGKLGLDSKVFLLTDEKEIELEDPFVCIHLKGYSRARVTHLDIEHEDLNNLIYPGSLLDIKGIKDGMEINFKGTYQGKKINGLRVLSPLLNKVLKPGQKTRTWVGGKAGGIYVGFRKNEMENLEKVASSVFDMHPGCNSNFGCNSSSVRDKFTNKIDLLLSNFPLYSEDLEIDLEEPEGRFKWFLASILFGARIGEKIAINTYKTFEKYGILSPDRILEAGWDKLVQVLDEGGYTRYDFSTATKLLGIAGKLKDKYGSLEELYTRSKDTEDLGRKLKEFKGIGDVTAQIFLRELRGVWKIETPPSNKFKETGKKLDIDLDNFEGKELSRVETALVKLNLRYCRHQICEKCPLTDFCEAAFRAQKFRTQKD
jgi:endonuclease III